MSVSQFGFLRGRSTLQQPLVFFNILLSSSSQTDVIYLDFRKAFDSVTHNELLYKIWKFGITGNFWLWLSAYLTNRIQFVSIGHSTSSTLPVICGVPQGSILGPVLYLIFINDLPSTLLSTKILLFADDAKCIMPISFLQDCINLQTDLSRLCEWCTTWNLSLNKEKCYAFHFYSRLSSASFIYQLNGQQILPRARVRTLALPSLLILPGVLTNRSISSKAYKMLGLLRRVFSSSVSVSVKRSLLHISRPFPSPLLLPYMAPVPLDGYVKKFSLWRATKFITNYTPIDYNRYHLIHLNLLPLMMELEIADVMFLVKSLKFPSDHFNICDHLQFCSRPTRACHNLKLKHSLCRSNLERNFYFNRIPRLWNSLPPLSIHLSLSTIKSKLRRYFWDQFIQF